MCCVVNYVAARDDFGAAEVFDRFLEITLGHEFSHGVRFLSEQSYFSGLLSFGVVGFYSNRTLRARDASDASPGVIDAVIPQEWDQHCRQ